MNDNRHVVELSECDDLRSRLRKSIMAITFWVVGGLACASITMFGVVYNKIDTLSMDQTKYQLETQKHMGYVIANIENINKQLSRLLDLNNNKQSKGTIVYDKSDTCSIKGDG